MADFHVYRDRLVIRLTRAEKVLALRRDDIVVPRDSIRSVAITADPWIWIRGVRSPGNSIPLTLAVGTWKFHGGKDFLVLKGKQRSAVVIDIEQPEAPEPAGEKTDGAAQEAGPAAHEDETAAHEDETAARGSAAAAVQKASGSATAGASGDADGDPGADAGANTEAEPERVADGFARVIVSTQHASKLVEALREIRPGSDGPVDEVIPS